MTQAIFLHGNVSEGFLAYGPYENIDEAAMAHDFQEGWLMELNEPVEAPKKVEEVSNEEYEYLVVYEPSEDDDGYPWMVYSILTGDVPESVDSFETEEEAKDHVEWLKEG